MLAWKPAAFLGIDPCVQNRLKAFRLYVLRAQQYPILLHRQEDRKSSVIARPSE